MQHYKHYKHHLLTKQHSNPVFARKYSAPANLKIDSPDVAQSRHLKYHAVRTVDVVCKKNTVSQTPPHTKTMLNRKP